MDYRTSNQRSANSIEDNPQISQITQTQRGISKYKVPGMEAKGDGRLLERPGEKN